MRKIILLSFLFSFSFSFSCFGQVASSDEMLKPMRVGREEMLEVKAGDVIDGDYKIEVESSSSMFRIAEAILHVKDGKFSATLSMRGKGYTKLFMGSAMEASQSNGKGEILADENESGQIFFEIPVSALNSPIKCAAFSKKKEKWYDRDILFDASTLPYEKLLVSPQKEEISLKKGNYYINLSLTGGSGKSSISNPARVSIKDGNAFAIIEWSSPNYDYMILNHEKYFADSKILDEGGNSTFKIPVYAFDKKIPVKADTTAMSNPHEISYWIEFDSKSAKKTWRRW